MDECRPLAEKGASVFLLLCPLLAFLSGSYEGLFRRKDLVAKSRR